MKQISILTNKKGIELSLNFIVMLIITLIVFGGTLAIAYKVMSKTDALKADMDKDTQDRLESIISNGDEEVIIAFKNKEAKAGNPVTFGIAVSNTLGKERDFSYNLTPAIKVLKDGTSSNWDGAGWVYLKTDNIGLIKNNDYMLTPFVIITPKNAASGSTYVFDVKVMYKDDGGTLRPYPARNPINKIRVILA